MQEHIAAREYRASENGERLQAPNRRHNLRTYFEADGIRVVDRTAAGSHQLLEPTLSRVGRGSEVQPVPEGTVHADGSRVEIRRPGLVEWFVNGPDGLEQGFTPADCALGWSVASAGDVKGDGYDDVIVGAYRFDGGGTDEGSAFVFLGGPDGVADASAASADATLESNQQDGAGDLARFRLLNGKVVGPKCATCPLPCQAGTTGGCSP